MTRAALGLLLFLTIAMLLPTRGAADGMVTISVGADRVSGEPLGFDGAFLRLRTAEGVVTLRYDPALCSGACPDHASFVPTLRLSGTPRIGTLVLPALIEAFARETGLALDRSEDGSGGYGYTLRDDAPRLRFSVRLTTTGDGLADLLAEEADVVMAGRFPDADELERARAAGLGDLSGGTFLLAVEPLLAVTAPTLPVRSLGLGQLESLLSGEILDWAAVGTPPQVARMHMAAEDDETPSLVSRIVPAPLAADRPVVSYDEPAALSAGIAADPGGFGLVPPTDVGLAHPLVLRGSCGLELQPDGPLVAAGDYPLSLPLLMIAPRRRLPPDAAAFLDWLETDTAQAVLRRSGVVGTSPQPIPVAGQGERFVAALMDAGNGIGELQRLARFVRTKQRLSPTFRFEGGSLDDLSVARLRALAAHLVDHPGERELWLVGFLDGPDAGIEGSRMRAETVRSALGEMFGGSLPEGLDLRIAAFGEALPVACPDTDLGRALNDRVELWESID